MPDSAYILWKDFKAGQNERTGAQTNMDFSSGSGGFGVAVYVFHTLLQRWKCHGVRGSMRAKG